MLFGFFIFHASSLPLHVEFEQFQNFKYLNNHKILLNYIVLKYKTYRLVCLK